MSVNNNNRRKEQIINMEILEAEVRELIQNSKTKRRTLCEPCDQDNLIKYLKSIQEEFNLYGIKYAFNPYSDLDDLENMKTAMVNLVNGTWNIILEYKKAHSDMKNMKSQNYAFQQNNNELNKTVDNLKKELELSNREIKELTKAKLEFVQKLKTYQVENENLHREMLKLKKVASSTKMQTASQMRRAENDFAKLENKFRGQCGVYSSKNEVKNVMVDDFRKKEIMYKETISKLEDANFKLLVALEKSALDDLSDSD